MGKTHKEPANYPSFTSYRAICGADSKNKGYTHRHWDWKKVDCKACLKIKKRDKKWLKKITKKLGL